MSFYIFWSLVFFILIAFFNAVMDVIDYKFYVSIFAKIKNEKIRTWFRSWHSDKPKAWYIPSQLKDGWHCSKGMIGAILIIDKMLLFFLLELSLSEVVVLAVMYIIFFYMLFRLFYEKILINKYLKRN
jgi:hypothetical protein